MWIRSQELGQRDADVTSRILYPPRVDDMASPVNMLHHYAWEESGFPLEWVEEFNKHLQAITCLTPHVEKILIDHGVTVPVSVSGCGIDHWDRIVTDSTFRLPHTGFKFLHVSSCFPRKGADLLLKAYGRAFSSLDDVVLVIKTFPNPHNEIDRWLREAVGDRRDFPRVEIIIEDFDNSRLKALYEACDVLVAPSRAEGFGLPMAEAMMSGLPVITTAWGGQLGFCKPEIAWLVDYQFERAQTHFRLSDSVWATADIGHLADTMRSVFEFPKKELRQRAAWSEKTPTRIPMDGSCSTARGSCGAIFGGEAVECALDRVDFHLEKDLRYCRILRAPTGRILEDANHLWHDRFSRQSSRRKHNSMLVRVWYWTTYRELHKKMR